MKQTMLSQLVSAAVLAMAAGSAHALINCTVTATDISTSYVPTNASATLVTGSYTVNCTRDSTSDPSSINYDLQANNGANDTTGSNNRVRLGTTTFFYNYELYRQLPVTGLNRWQITNTRRFAGTVNFSGASLIASHGPITFYLNIPPQVEDPAGTYTDRVTMTLQEDAAGNRLLDGISGFNVEVNTVKRCIFSTPASTLSFEYTSFQTTAAAPVAPSTFLVRCTRQTPYTVALDATSGVVLGLQYSLSLNPAGRTGTSANQNFDITGSIPAGQAGACTASTCSGTQQRTLTISY